MHPGILGTLPGMPRTPSPQPTPADNPAGPPEGTDHGHAGAGTLTDPAAYAAEAPQAGDLGATTPTTEDEPPTPLAGDLTAPGDPVESLATYLALHHPGAAVTPDEHPAHTALRLLTRLGARGDQGARCTAPYCNLPALHAGEHGWVHVEPRG